MNLLDKFANPFSIQTPTNMKTSLYHNNYHNYIKLMTRFFNIFRVFCQHLNDHNAVEKQTETMINTCLNQKIYKKYISEVVEEPYDRNGEFVNKQQCKKATRVQV